ncbi:PepSY-like domain-containing protein [Cytophaga aurantiaca]|uniref:PepSY-like domain-containing protein n=1 Tax=Cytophaga aurantiaca TaxID=29530 RepID=UPI00035EEC67|nr:PepSY-like domain-containing protein [Cytophaga aurantiaca]
MKKITLITALLISVWSVQAQKIEPQNVPASVTQSFNKLFPDVVSVKWELEEDNYEAKYKKNDIKFEAIFSSTGTLIQTEKSLSSPNDLPLPVLNALKKNFSGFTYKDAEMVTAADGEVLYEVEAENASITYELLYDANGNIVKKESIEENGKKNK